MNYIVLDLEWNQSPTGKKDEIQQMPFEIVEIGAVRLDENLRIQSTFQEIVRPSAYREMHFMCREITRLTPRELRKGDRFPQVFQRFLEWCGDDYMLCTWGDMDLTELQKNIRYHGLEIPFPFPFYFYDIQKLFSHACQDGGTQRSLKYAADYFGLEETLDFHRALSDACYTAMIMGRIDFASMKQRVSIDYYRIPQNVREEVKLFYGSSARYVSIGYNTKEELLRRKKVMETACCICGKPVKKKVRWFSDNGKNYYALAVCPEHGFIKGSIRIRRNEQGKYFAVKTLKNSDELALASILEKKEQIRNRKEHRRQKEIRGGDKK